MLGFLRRLRSQPRPVKRPRDYAIAGESWRGYVPPEPMLDSTARDAESCRNRGVRDAAWREAAEGARNRLSGRCVTNSETLFCVAHGRSIVACRVRDDRL